MKKFTYFLSGLLLISSFAFAQNTRTLGGKISTGATQAQLEQKEAQLMQSAERTPDGKIRCFSQQADELLRMKYPELGTQEEYEAWLAPKIEEWKKNGMMNGNKVIFNIPVVVHVIHNGDAVGTNENISQLQVNSQIAVLNEDFRKVLGSRGDGAGVDVEIEFCLAVTDPSAQTMPEPGIDRVNLGVATWSSMSTINANMKPPTSWDPNNYFNIWTCNLGGGLLGYAQFPNSSGLAGLNTNNGAANTDGVVILASAFGSNDAAGVSIGGVYNLGRTSTHEIGHFFGLRHIWGDSNCGNDYCADTPQSASANYGCPTQTTCDGNQDQVENYMDYTDDACMNMFTLNQKQRMVTVMGTSPRRASLATSTVCGAAVITANFNANVTTINAGQTVTFTDASTSPNTLNGWTWNFDATANGGVSPATATTQGPHVVTYNTVGIYSVSLQVTDNASGTDLVTKTAYIIVNPFGSSTCDSTAANWDLAIHGPTTGTYTWGAGNGYVLGQNTYGDNGWADKITYSTPGKELTDVLFYFGVASGTGNVNLNVWGETASKPGTIMTTQSVAISSLLTGGTPTLWSLASPAALSGNFYIGFDHNALVAGDTAAAMSASTGTNTVWAYESTPTWTDLSAYSLDHGMAIIPVICDIATGEKELIGDLKEVSVFPNPSQGTINVALTSKVQSTIEIFNIVGALVYTAKPFNSQLISIDVNNQPNGVYFVNIKTGNDIITKKIVLSK